MATTSPALGVTVATGVPCSRPRGPRPPRGRSPPRRGPVGPVVGAGAAVGADVDDAGDPARTRRHHHDPVGEEHRLRDGVGHEEHRGPGLGADPRQLGLHPLPGHLVERAERLVHEQQPRAARQGPGRSRPAAACRRRAGRGGCSAKSVRPTSSISSATRAPALRRVRRRAARAAARCCRRRCATAGGPPAGRRCRSPGRAAPAGRVLPKTASVARRWACRGRRPAASASHLPQPDGPISETNSPSRHGQVDVGAARRTLACVPLPKVPGRRRSTAKSRAVVGHARCSCRLSTSVVAEGERRAGATSAGGHQAERDRAEDRRPRLGRVAGGGGRRRRRAAGRCRHVARSRPRRRRCRRRRSRRRAAARAAGRGRRRGAGAVTQRAPPAGGVGVHQLDVGRGRATAGRGAHRRRPGRTRGTLAITATEPRCSTGRPPICDLRAPAGAPAGRTRSAARSG